MNRILTPCLPRKTCVICEARMFPKAASPEKRAAKYAHQARWYGHVALQQVFTGHEELAAVAARRAVGYARLALDMDAKVALAS